MVEMKRERKKSEVGGGKSTSIIGQAVVKGIVEVFVRGLLINNRIVVLHLRPAGQKNCLRSSSPQISQSLALQLTLLNVFMETNESRFDILGNIIIQCISSFETRRLIPYSNIFGQYVTVTCLA